MASASPAPSHPCSPAGLPFSLEDQREEVRHVGSGREQGCWRERWGLAFRRFSLDQAPLGGGQDPQVSQGAQARPAMWGSLEDLGPGEAGGREVRRVEAQTGSQHPRWARPLGRPTGHVPPPRQVSPQHRAGGSDSCAPSSPRRWALSRPISQMRKWAQVTQGREASPGVSTSRGHTLPRSRMSLEAQTLAGPHLSPGDDVRSASGLRGLTERRCLPK